MSPWFRTLDSDSIKKKRDISSKRTYIQRDCPLTFFFFLHSDDYNKIVKSHGDVETMIFKLKLQNSKGLQQREKCVSGKKHSYC